MADVKFGKPAGIKGSVKLVAEVEQISRYLVRLAVVCFVVEIVKFQQYQRLRSRS